RRAGRALGRRGDVGGFAVPARRRLAGPPALRPFGPRLRSRRARSADQRPFDLFARARAAAAVAALAALRGGRGPGGRGLRGVWHARVRLALRDRLRLDGGSLGLREFSGAYRALRILDDETVGILGAAFLDGVGLRPADRR